MRIFTGVLLIIAAVLKAVSLQATAFEALTPTSEQLTQIQTMAELALGILVLSGAYWKVLRWIVLFTFSAFACYSLYLAERGAASCGCFGPIHVPPWYTFVLDATIILGLILLWRRDTSDNTRPTEFLRRAPHWTVLAAILLSISTVWIVSSAPTHGRVRGGFLQQANTILLEPNKWIGKDFPLASYIDIDVSKGKWIILFHRHDCSQCQAVLPKYAQDARARRNIAFIEVPPFGESEDALVVPKRARLSSKYDWIVQTPTEVLLEEGVVTAVTNPKG